MSTQPIAPNEALEVKKEDASMSIMTASGFELMQRVGKAYATSSLVPKEFAGNLPNCVIALNMAYRLGADPLMVMQNLYVVHGRPGWSSQFLIATFNQNGAFSKLRYEFFGDKGSDAEGCRAYAIEKETGERLTGADITIGLSKKEGWYGKQGSKWQTMPQQMLMYRAAAWFIRAYAPEIAMGLKTSEELSDASPEINISDIGKVIDRKIENAPSKLDALVDAEQAKGAPTTEEPAKAEAEQPKTEAPKTPDKPKAKKGDADLLPI